MERPATYNTKQHEAILNYVASFNRAHVTATQIAEHFEKENIPIARTTIYRQLDKLTRMGKLRKYTIDGVFGFCYQYTDKEMIYSGLHLKCEDCGELVHYECDTLNNFQKHLLDEHAFEVNTQKTVLYGKCGNCVNKV